MNLPMVLLLALGALAASAVVVLVIWLFRRQAVLTRSRQRVCRTFSNHSGRRETGPHSGPASASRSLEESYGGQISVQSTPGEGTTFQFTLRVA